MNFTYNRDKSLLTRPNGSFVWLDREHWPLLRAWLASPASIFTENDVAALIRCAPLARYGLQNAAVHIAVIAVDHALAGSGRRVEQCYIEKQPVWHLVAAT